MQLTQSLLKIFEVKPENRHTKAISSLRNLVGDIAFFQKLEQDMGENALIKCLKYLKLEIRPPGDVVCRKGEMGYTFYIVLQGAVHVYVTSQQDQQMQDEIKRRKTKISIDNSITAGMVKVNTLIAGQAFGELALLRSGPRMATIICSDVECIFATLTKKDYLNVLAEHELQKQVSLKEELRKVFVFKNLSERGLQMLLYSCEPLTFVFREYVIRQGQSYKDDPSIYIIRNGDFRVLKTNVSKDFEQKIFKTEVCNLSSGELFGELEIFKLVPRMFTVQCASSQGDVYRIKASEFQKVFSATNEWFVLDQIRDAAVNKYDFLQVKAQKSQKKAKLVLSPRRAYFDNSFEYQPSFRYLKTTTQRLTSQGRQQLRQRSSNYIANKTMVFNKLSASTHSNLGNSMRSFNSDGGSIITIGSQRRSLKDTGEKKIEIFRPKCSKSEINQDDGEAVCQTSKIMNKQNLIENIIKSEKKDSISDNLRNLQQQENSILLVKPGKQDKIIPYWPVKADIYLQEVQTKQELINRCTVKSLPKPKNNLRFQLQKIFSLKMKKQVQLMHFKQYRFITDQMIN